MIARLEPLYPPINTHCPKDRLHSVATKRFANGLINLIKSFLHLKLASTTTCNVCTGMNTVATCQMQMH